MAAVGALQPDLYVTLADEVGGDAKPKRVAAAVARTGKVGEGYACFESVQHGERGRDGR